MNYKPAHHNMMLQLLAALFKTIFAGFVWIGIKITNLFKHKK